MAAAVGEKRPVPEAPTAEEIQKALDRILSSKHFAQAPKKQRFLQLICEAHLNGRASELNEYVIGYEVFDRAESYNPALDPIVRVGAHELRKKLERYYQNEGRDDEILLEIPIGSYIPNFSRRHSSPTVDAPARVSDPALPFLRDVRIWMAVIIVSLVIAAALLAASNRQLRQQAGAGIPEKQIQPSYVPVWSAIFADSTPPLLVLSNPPVYRFWNPADPEALFKKSVELSRAEADALSEALGEERFATQNGPIRRVVLSSDEYTGVGEAIALHRVTTLLNRLGKSAIVKQSRTVSAEDLKNHDVILLRSAWVNEWSGKIRIKEDFVLGASATVINQNPIDQEAREYRARFDDKTGKLVEDYAIVTLKPNISDSNTVMLLAGTHSEGTEAAAEFVTSEGYLAELSQRLAEFGDDRRYFQVLLRVGVDNGIPTTISIVALHKLYPGR